MLVKTVAGVWKVTNWFYYTKVPQASKRVVATGIAWIIMMTARERGDLDDYGPEVSEAVSRDLSLPHIMKVLVEGSKVACIKLILDLHRKNYHKHPDKLKAALELAGVPSKTLAMVDEAIELCGDCRAHGRIKAVPRVALKLITRFNYEACFDLVFFMD